MPTLDEAIDGVLAGAPKKDPLADAVAQTLRDDSVRTRQHLLGATKSSPDEAAKAVRLGAEQGLPSDVVLRNLQEVNARSVVNAASQVLGSAPTLNRLVTERPDLPKQAIDEIDKLAALEQQIRAHGELKSYNGPKPTAGSVLGGLAKTVPQTFTAVRDSIRLQMGDLFDSLGLLPRDEVDKREALRRSEQSLARTTYDDPDFESATARAVYGGLKSTVQQGAGIAASIATGNPAAALATIGIQSQAQAYTKYRARGASGAMSALGSVGEGAVEVGTELLPMGFLVDKLGKTGMREFMAGLLAREIPSEQVATLLQDALDTAIANPDKTWDQYLAERPGAAYQTLVATITQSVVMGGANSALERYSRAVNETNNAGRDAEVLRALSALSAQVKLRERNPDEFRSMLQSMVEDAEGAPTTVRFDARTLVGEDGSGGLLNQEEMAQFPALAEQMAEAVATGGEITMPVADLLTVAPGTPLEQKLLENARIGDNELSQLEAKEAAAQAETYLQQEAERVTATVQDADAVRTSAEVVKQKMVDQLNATKRFTPDVNEAYATLVQSFYTVLGNRLGVTPEQAYAAYPLRVQGENPAAPGEVLNEKSQRPGALTVEGYHFSKEARPVISTSMFGTGLEGSGREQYQNAKDVRLRKRSSFYVDKGTGINPEAGVGGIGHKVALSNVYDANSDPLRLRRGNQLDFESAVLDAGYSGYLDRLEGTQSGQVVMLGDQQFQPEVLGPLSKTSGAVVPPPAARESRGRDLVSDALKANKSLPAGAPTLAQWERMLASMMPAEHQALTEAGVFEGDPEENVYKSDLIRRFEENTPAEDYAQRTVKNMTPAIGKLLRNLTPSEQAKVGDATAAKVIAQLKNLPSAKEMAAVAFAGRAKRGWYRQSAETISAVFGPDGPRFAGLLAAMSPQCSVETNLLNALNTWKNWVAAGRPQTRDEIVAIMGRSVQGNNLTDSVLPAWINNSLRALTSEDPGAVTMSGPKVNSFYRNLIGDVNEVTNDAWMANFALVDQTIFSGSLTKGGDPGKGTGYLAMNARVREAAATLTKLTGETWTPAEVQETVWSWAKTLYEMSANANEQRTARELIQEGALTDDLINSTPDFGSLFYNPKYATILEEAGYGDQLASLGKPVDDAAGQPEEGTEPASQAGPFAPEDQRRYELQAARRLEQLAEERGNARAAAADRSVEDQLAEANAQASEVLEQADTTATLADFTPANVGNLLSRTDWAILTAENPAGRQASAEDNAAAMARLRADLDALGVRYTDAIGKYGQVENSVAIAGITEEEAALLGAKYGQESVLTPRGLVYMADGHVVPVTGQVDTFDTEPEDFYTTIPSTGARFAIGLDFEAGTEGAVLAQPAYHGTAYRSIDKFSTEHIGKGEGAQVYGWGLYFASNAEIAEFYRRALTQRLEAEKWSRATGEAVGSPTDVIQEVAGDMTWEFPDDNLSQHSATRFAETAMSFMREQGKTRAEAEEAAGDDKKLSAAVRLLYEGYRVEYTPPPKGQLYEVDVPNDDELLAYDAPLKDQPAKVKAALEGLGVAPTRVAVVSNATGEQMAEFASLDMARRAIKSNNWDAYPETISNKLTGKEAYRSISYKLGSDEAASKALLAAGVKGLKYLDANSRGPTASKNYNFVVFSGDDVAIRNQYYQGPRGTFNPNTLTVSLLQSANLSTFLHETGHFFLEVMADVAAQPNAPVGVVDDMGKLLGWFGVKDLATWNGMTLDQKRKHHERFAESFEQYLLEGKAPNPELQPLFQRFRAWLVNVYRSLSEFMRGRNLELSDEVRGVFDRMLATDQQIKQAEDLRAYSLLFKSAEQAGMTPEAWAEYQRQGAQATHDAIDKLQARSVKDMRWVSGARSRALKNLQREAEGKRRAIETEVAAEVAQQPTYQALRWLRKGEMTTAEGEEIKAEKGFRLNTAALAEMYPDTALDNPDLARLKGLTAANGLHPDVVAAMFGFDSGDTLVRTLVEAQPQAAVVEGMTDQRMLERFGDLATPQGLARAADEAVHNEARGRFIATGLRALQEANGKTEKTATGGSVNVMVRAAKQFAEQLIARRKVRELKPGQHTQAEQRAGRAAQQAMAKNDTQAAIVAQRDQLLNHYAARATNDAIDETERALAYLKKFDKESIRKKLPIEYVDQIDKLLERVDLRQQTNAAIDKRSKLAAWIKAQQDMGIEVELPDYLLEDAKLTSYKDMSVEAFRGLVATVKQIEHLGRLKNKLLTAKDEREFAAIRDSMVQSVLDNAGSREADTRTPTTVLGKKLAAVKAFGAAHIKAATYARIFDGGKDGGPVWEYLVRPANAAADRETKMNAEATAELAAILDPWRKAGNPNRRTPAPSIGRSLTRQERLVIALNIGNEGNLQRLLGGEGWTPAQLKPVLDELTKDDWATVQAVWDHFEKRRALIDEVERSVYGKPLKKVDPGSAFTEAYKVKGGYYPIVYDPAASQRAEEHADAEAAKRQLAGAYSAANVRRGFTKARAEEVVGRPLMYDLSGVYRGVRDQIHYIAWTEWVIDANRILRDKGIDAAVRQKYGPEAVRQLKTWRDAIAEGDGAAQEAMDTALGWMRRSVSVAGLGFNVMSAMIQPLGFTQSITRVGAGWVGRGVLSYLANPVRATREVNGKSDFMANRSRTRFREINELRNRVEQQTAAKRFMNENAFMLMMRMQQLVDVPTWLGAYEKAIAAGNTEDRSRALADQAVIDAQGGGQTKDLSAIERGGPAQKLFTVFYSFMNTALNLGVASKMSPKSRAKFAADMVMLYMVPAVLGVMLKNALTPGDSGDEDEKLMQKLLAEQVGYLFGLIVLGREVGEAAKTALGLSDHPRDYSGPAGVRALSDAYQFSKQAGQGEFDDSFRKALVNLSGDLLGLPSAQINRTITGAQALKEGKTQNPAALLFGYQEPR